MKPVILVVAHGSREKAAQGEFKRLLANYRRRHPGWKITHAFLEFTEPSIPQALETIAGKMDQIIVLPLFLFTAKHVRKHIPEIIKNFRKNHPKVKIHLARALGADPLLFPILNQRIKEMRTK